MNRMALMFVVLFVGCCNHPDLRPVVRSLGGTIKSIKKRANNGVVEITRGLAARIDASIKLADKALEAGDEEPRPAR